MVKCGELGRDALCSLSSSKFCCSLNLVVGTLALVALEVEAARAKAPMREGTTETGTAVRNPNPTLPNDIDTDSGDKRTAFSATMGRRTASILHRSKMHNR